MVAYPCRLNRYLRFKASQPLEGHLSWFETYISSIALSQYPIQLLCVTGASGDIEGLRRLETTQAPSPLCNALFLIFLIIILEYPEECQ